MRMSVSNIPISEFKERQRRALEEAVRRGFKGLLVWSRSGATYDRHMNVMYLTNYYSPFPYLPDFPPHWTGRGHSALIMPADGEPVLVVDETFDFEVAVEDVRVTRDVFGELVKALREKRLDKGAVGLVGADTFPVTAYEYVRKELPELRFVWCDDILEDLRMIKSENELRIIRKGCELASKAMKTLFESISPGRTKAELAADVYEELVEAGAEVYMVTFNFKYPPYSAERRFRKGEMVNVDLWGAYKGYIYDFSRTTVVGAEPTREQEEIIEVTLGSVQAVIEAVKPGVIAEELEKVGNEYLKERGYLERREEDFLDFQAWGHGMGLSFEKPWLISGDKTVIRPGMYLAVENAIGDAMFEDDFIVTEKGVEVLTTTPLRWW